MTRLHALLLAVLLACSLYLVRVSYESRRLVGQLDAARGENATLEAEFKRLESERQAQATNLRVQRVARERLHMFTATPAVMHTVVDAAGAGASR